MFWFAFEVRNHARGWSGLADEIAAEISGTPRRVYVTSGKVRAWTRWGACRYIRAKFGEHLLEIVDVRKAVA